MQPPLYYLEDLMKDPVEGSFYKQQLKSAPDPTDSEYWDVEKVIKTRTQNGLKQSLVKFRYYPGEVS